MSSTNFMKFQCWGDYLTHVQQRPTEHCCHASDDGEYSFTRTQTWNEAMNLAQEGWHDAEADARKISNALMQRVGALVERDEELYDVEGYGVDVSLYNQGIPECWMRNEQKYIEQPGPIVRVVYTCDASGGVGADVLTAKGATVSGLIECIELSGRSVELWLAINIAHPLEIRVKIKEAGQPLDMGRVMFALAHPSSLRRLGFRMVELHRPQLSFVGYGCCTDSTEERGDLYIPMSIYGDPQWCDAQVATAWVIQKLREQNVQVNDATV